MSEPAVPRRGRPGHDQAAVLRAAIDLFNRKGYDATSIGDVADELGVTKSAVYHHVPSKEPCSPRRSTKRSASSRPGVPGGGGRRVGVRTAARGGPPQRRGAGRPPACGDPAAAVTATARPRRPRSSAAAGDTRLASLVGRAAEEGALRADVDPDLVSRLLFGMVNSLVEWYRPSGPVDVEQLADAVTAIAFEGLDR